MATFYAMTVPEFLDELDLGGRNIFDPEWRLPEGEGALIAARTGLSTEAAQAMTFRDIVPAVRMMITRKNRHHCTLCPEEVHRISAALPWRFRCPVHGVAFRDATGGTLSEMLDADRFSELETCADAGAAVLDSGARGEGLEAMGPVELLAFLTARHRRASPPNVSEQPRMSLGARRDYHAFLTAPIIRQALTVIVPEYDHVAPVLAKPVRPGLHSLAQGSLLQAFALTAGIGRLADDPVRQAIAVLLASDAEGQGRVQDVLRPWPLSLRRRISARLWRAQRDESARQSAENAKRRRQSHKLRHVQSQKYRYGIS